MRKSIFEIDACSDDIYITGWTDDSTWNGWSNIWVEKDELLRYFKQWPDANIEVRGDAIVFTDIGCDPDILTPCTLDGIPVPVYSMNGYCFSEAEKPTNKEAVKKARRAIRRQYIQECLQWLQKYGPVLLSDIKFIVRDTEKVGIK